MLERAHQKVRRPHPELELAEGMLDRLSPYPHQVRVPIQRCCMVSSTDSCSHRLTRRCAADVHCVLIAQALQAELQ